ncbi:MAG: right-handed parallel beta-helix repeat-containing protein, partial [Nitriliruptoraceae bacterium]
GGALSVQGGSSVTVSRTRFHGNEAGLLGGAIYATAGADVTVTNATFTNHDGTGAVVATADAGTSVALAFTTIAHQDDAFSATGGSAITVTDSAMLNVQGCGDLSSHSGSIADAASDGACAPTQVGDVKLVDDVSPPYLRPASDSPLVAAALGTCPSVDQRGFSRSSSCTVGAVESAGVICPTGPLPRGEQISCDLDVTLHGPTAAVHAQHNPVVFDDLVAIADGAGSFTFVLSTTDPSDDVVITINGGAYTATVAVAALGGSGGGGGGTGSGESAGDSGGQDPNDCDPDDPTPDSDCADMLMADDTSPSRHAGPSQLALTGSDRRPVLGIAFIAFLLGVLRLRTAARGSDAVRDAK